MHHHFTAGGARIRARLALEAALALNLPRRKAIAAASCCELLHNASLIHDDLQDRDATRRGAPAVWAEFGPEIAICAGDFLLSAAYAALATLGEDAAAAIAHVHSRVGVTISGQTADLQRGEGAARSIHAYEIIAAGKSGPLLSLPLELALRLSGDAKSIGPAARAAHAFALGYQILDDIDDADADALSGEPNILAILAEGGAADPVDAALRRACTHFETASREAAALPNGVGAMLSAHIDALRTRAESSILEAAE